MRLHNPTATPVVFDTAGHQVDAWGTTTGNQTDAVTAELVAAGVLRVVPEKPKPVKASPKTEKDA